MSISYKEPVLIMASFGIIAQKQLYVGPNVRYSTRTVVRLHAARSRYLPSLTLLLVGIRCPSSDSYLSVLFPHWRLVVLPYLSVAGKPLCKCAS